MKHFFKFVSLLRMIVLLVLAGNGALAQAQAPAWQMALAAGGGGSRVDATVADVSGDVYVAGGFYGMFSFGSTTLVSAGSSDIFVAKWSSSSNRFG